MKVKDKNARKCEKKVEITKKYRLKKQKLFNIID